MVIRGYLILSNGYLTFFFQFSIFVFYLFLSILEKGVTVTRLLYIISYIVFKLVTPAEWLTVNFINGYL